MKAEKRIPEPRARKIIRKWLKEEYPGEDPPFNLIEDGDSHWAFWILPDDTTSYLHPDGLVEWYGSAWEPEQQ